MLQPGATNVYLTVDDLQEHVGTSGLFQVVGPEAIRFGHVQWLTNGSFQMSVEALLGKTYTLSTSANLSNWVPAFNFVCTNFPTTIADPAAPGARQRFYRVVGPATP